LRHRALGRLPAQLERPPVDAGRLGTLAGRFVLGAELFAGFRSVLGRLAAVFARLLAIALLLFMSAAVTAIAAVVAILRKRGRRRGAGQENGYEEMTHDDAFQGLTSTKSAHRSMSRG
jgi:hypothetical protein